MSNMYVGTSGSTYMDYYICDPIACEKDSDFTELLINLPHTVVAPIREINDVNPGNPLWDNEMDSEATVALPQTVTVAFWPKKCWG